MFKRRKRTRVVVNAAIAAPVRTISGETMADGSVHYSQSLLPGPDVLRHAMSGDGYWCGDRPETDRKLPGRNHQFAIDGPRHRGSR